MAAGRGQALPPFAWQFRPARQEAAGSTPPGSSRESSPNGMFCFRPDTSERRVAQERLRSAAGPARNGEAPVGGARARARGPAQQPARPLPQDSRPRGLTPPWGPRLWTCACVAGLTGISGALGPVVLWPFCALATTRHSTPRKPCTRERSSRKSGVDHVGDALRAPRVCASHRPQLALPCNHPAGRPSSSLC